MAGVVALLKYLITILAAEIFKVPEPFCLKFVDPDNPQVLIQQAEPGANALNNIQRIYFSVDNHIIKTRPSGFNRKVWFTLARNPLRQPRQNKRCPFLSS